MRSENKNRIRRHKKWIHVEGNACTANEIEEKYNKKEKN